MSHDNKWHGKIVFGHSGDIKIFDMSSSNTNTIISTYKTPMHVSQPVWGGSDILYISVKDSLSAPTYIAKINDKGENFHVVIKRHEHCDFPELSPDKRDMAFLCGQWEEKLGRIDYRLAIMKLGGHELKLNILPVLPYKPSWSPDGEDVAVVDLDKNITLVNCKTGNTKKLTKGIAPAFSPDGKFVAYFRQIPGSNKSDLMLYDMAGNTSRQIIKSKLFGNSPQWTPDASRVLYQRYGIAFIYPEKIIIESYFIKQNTSRKLLEVRNNIHGFSLNR